MKTPYSFAAIWVAFGVSLQASQPNVVIFLADDAGWGDYSHSGNMQVRTPNIDSIAMGGVSLDIPGKSVMDVRRVTLTLFP